MLLRRSKRLAARTALVSRMAAAHTLQHDNGSNVACEHRTDQELPPQQKRARTSGVVCVDTGHDGVDRILPACDRTRRSNDASVTSFINSFFEPFDAAAVAQRIVSSDRCATDPTYAYYRVTSPEAVQRMWELNNRYGKVLHKQIDTFYKTGERPAQVHADFAHFLAFHERVVVARQWRAVATEYEMYEKVLRLRGVVDAVFQRPSDGALVLVDWKRVNGSVACDYGTTTMAMAPLDAVPDTRFSKYALQLEAYRDTLQRTAPLRVAELYIVNLHPAMSSYECTAVHDDPVWSEHWHNLQRCRWSRHMLDTLDALGDRCRALRQQFCDWLEATPAAEDDDVSENDSVWLATMHEHVSALENDTPPASVQRLRALLDFFRQPSDQ